MWHRRITWSLAWAMAVAGAMVVAAAAVPTRAIGVLVPVGGAFVRASPRHVELAGWRHNLWPPDWFGDRWRTVCEGGSWSVLTHVGDERIWIGTVRHEADRAVVMGRFGYVRGLNDFLHIRSFREVFAPTWFVVSIAIAPLLCLVAHRRWWRPLPGCCRACGYDLRASPDRCPECGTKTNLAPSNNQYFAKNGQTATNRADSRLVDPTRL